MTIDRTDLDRLRGHDERVLLRRATDKVMFDQCPKYQKHDLTHEQMIEIVEMAIKRIDEKKNIEFAQYIKSESKTMLPRIIVAFGTFVIAVIILLHDKGLLR